MSVPVSPGSPLVNPGFRLLWGGQALSQVGFQFQTLAMPVIAVTLLHATEADMGFLNAANTAAFLLVGLLAGGWVDRMRKRQVMIVADAVRAVAICAIPVLWSMGILAVWHLYVIAGLIGVATVFFDVGYQSYLPILVPSEQVGRANGVLEGTAQIARLGGPSVAGALLTIVAAPWLMLINAVGFACSALLLGVIRDDERPRPVGERQRLLVEIREGITFVVGQPLLRVLVTSTMLSNLGSTIIFTLLTLVVLRDLGLAPELLGVVFSAGAVGGIAGALFASRISERLGEGPSLRASTLLGTVGVAGFAVAAYPPLRWRSSHADGGRMHDEPGGRGVQHGAGHGTSTVVPAPAVGADECVHPVRGVGRHAYRSPPGGLVRGPARRARNDHHRGVDSGAFRSPLPGQPVWGPARTSAPSRVTRAPLQ